MIITMDDQERVFKDGAIVIDADKIIAINQSSLILAEFGTAGHDDVDIINLNGKILIPGLINTHVHTAQQLGRGIADDVDLMTWLHKSILPYESNMTEEDSYLSTLLCGIELIHSGVTCFAEAGGQHVSGMARAVELLGLRACLVQSTMDCDEGLPEKWGVQSTDYCIQHHNTADGRIRMWFGIRQIMNATDKLLFETRDAAKELNTGIHMHVAEIAYENEFVTKTREVDHGTVTSLKKIELLQPNLLAAHSIWVDDTEIGFLSKAGVKVSHCPAAAMRMLGFAPVKEMLDAGICVSLGTDGAPSNNRMSIVLWDNEIGSLEVCKKADMVIVDPFSWSMLPVHDCISSLVYYSLRTENIEAVMCNGQWIMKDRKMVNIEEGQVFSVAKEASQELLKRAGITVPSRMNFI
ncbi:hypothetical protein C5167_007012 [Papaver somniferum]|uniref:Amidohydrolase-related domain-containing protein n=1 Tax=Papaver somniferum TaxID=3469 RepID=A0A4Y7JIS8_PAPSO|nr:hypothetical protein C5167_007012 [Papaver somniferum]